MADPSAWRENVSPDDPSASPYPAHGGGAGAEESLSNIYTELYGPGRPSGAAAGPPGNAYASGGGYAGEPYAGDAYAGDAYAAAEAYEPVDDPGDDWRGGYGPRRRGGGFAARWLNGTTAAVAGGLALVIAVTGIVLATRGNNASAQGGLPERQIPAPGPDVQDSPGKKRRLPTSPVLGAIRDRNAGISYARLGGAWSLARNQWMRDHGWPTGQDAVAMKNFDGDADYLSGCYSGPLIRAVRYNGVEDLKAATEDLARRVERADDVYPRRHQTKLLESRAFNVGNRSGWLVRLELRFPQARREGWKFNKEIAAFVVVDRGERRRPSMLFMTLPSSHKAQGDINLVLNSLRPA